MLRVAAWALAICPYGLTCGPVHQFRAQAGPHAA